MKPSMMHKLFIKLFMWCGLVAAGFITPATPVLAQESMSSVWQRSTEFAAKPAQPSKSKIPSLLERPVDIDLKNMRIVDAIQAVAKAGGVKVTYADGLAKIEKRVSVEGKNIPLKEAFAMVLRGTSMGIRVVPPNEIVVGPAKGSVNQDTAAIRVTVMDSVTKRPIPNVLVELRGTNKRVLTNDQGEATLPYLAAGQYSVTVRRLGYTSVTRSVTVTTGQNTKLTVNLTVAVSTLSEVVTTGAGERQKLEIGNSIATMNADSVMATTPVSTMTQLLENRLPGLMLVPGSGAVGAPKRLRLRGVSSILSDNAPVIILDGVRISSASKTCEANTITQGVQAGPTNSTSCNDLSSRLDDLDPNSIESIEELKGPSASTLYGSDAANGVIVIKTKRGKAGPPRWNVYADRRELFQSKDYEFAQRQIGYPLAGGGAQVPNCSLSQIANGNCVPIEGQFMGFNMLQNSRFTPQAHGHEQSIGGNVSGGTSIVQYFLGGTYLDQLGTAKLPDVTRLWVERATGTKLEDELLRPNARSNISGNARITGTFGGQSDWAVGGSINTQYQRVGNDGMAGLMSTSTPRVEADTTPFLDGWANWYATREQTVRHVVGNASTNWRPSWRDGQLFSARGTYGWDFSLNDDKYFAKRGSCAPLCASATDQGAVGYVNSGRGTRLAQTLDLGGSLNLPITPWLMSQTRFGGNYVRNTYYDLYGNATGLAVGREYYGATTTFINDYGNEAATAGWYLEQAANLRQNRLFLTMGMRQDASSNLGEDVKPIYPKWNVSWVASEEPFFPWKDNALLRFRFAFGNAGVMPTSIARVRTWAMQSNFVLDNGSPTGLFAELGSPGNPEIRPEHSREYEGGFDLELFQSRVTFDFTMFRKYTWDAIQQFPVAGSIGPSVIRAYLGNVGDVVNNGFELVSNVRLLDRDAISYNLRMSLTSSSNELTSMAPGVVTFISLSGSGDAYTGNDSRIIVGYPLFGRWAYPILGWADENSNGFIDPLEVRVGDSLQYVGPTLPKYEATFGHSIGLLRNRVTVNANFAYSRGQTQFNSARKAMVSNLAVGQGLGSLADQACIVATAVQGQRRATDWCFMETVKSLRFQNLSIGYTLQPSIARLFRAQSATILLTGDNIALWSNFKGRDPALNVTPVNGNAVVAGTAFAAPRRLGTRLNLTF